jgi:hypothetical protein
MTGSEKQTFPTSRGQITAFSADKMDLGRTNIVERYIDLRDKEPVNMQQFRLPIEQIEFIKENVMGWLDAGIVKRANLPYKSLIFCVRKKQGQGSDVSSTLDV